MRSKILAAFAILACATLCAGQNTIRIGIITSITGSQAAFGEAHRNGYSIALDQINAKGGVLGKKLNWTSMMTRASRTRPCKACRSSSTRTTFPS